MVSKMGGLNNWAVQNIDVQEIRGGSKMGDTENRRPGKWMARKMDGQHLSQKWIVMEKWAIIFGSRCRSLL